MPNAGAYVSESNYFEKEWQQSYWGSNYPRLAEIKKKIRSGRAVLRPQWSWVGAVERRTASRSYEPRRSACVQATGYRGSDRKRIRLVSPRSPSRHDPCRLYHFAPARARPSGRILKRGDLRTRHVERCSLAAPHGLAFFQERADAFLGVIAGADLDRKFVEVVVLDFEGAADRASDHAFHRADGERSVARNFFRPLGGGLVKLIVRNDFVHQAHLARPRRVHRFRQVHDFRSVRRPRDFGEPEPLSQRDLRTAFVLRYVQETFRNVAILPLLKLISILLNNCVRRRKHR